MSIVASATDLYYNYSMPQHIADDQVWPTCTYTDCSGVRAHGFARCLRHLRQRQLSRVLRRMRPGGDLDIRGTHINAELLARILRAIQDGDERPTFGRVLLTGAQFTQDADFRAVSFIGNAVFTDVKFARNAVFIGADFTGGVMFDGAQFSADAVFYGIKFTGVVNFENAQFKGTAWFASPMFTDGTQFVKGAKFDSAHFAGRAMFAATQFTEDAGFTRARFADSALFHDVQFAEEAWFIKAEFGQDATFDGAQFSTTAWFTATQFTGDASFQGARFNDASFADSHFQKTANFVRARFEEEIVFGPLAANSLNLEWAEFVLPLAGEVASATISCRNTTWRAGVALRLRYGTIDLERATFTRPSFVTGTDQLFRSNSGSLDEEQVRKDVVAQRGESADLWMPIIKSLRGSDVDNLHITDVDLSQCLFAGALLLDQLRFEGRCIFDHPPHGVHGGWAWPPLWRWSNRQSIAEERTWRATTRKHWGWSVVSSSQPAEIGPERLVGLYRQLRKAQEDVKNEPGAADFYYGEMEMRRHARTTPGAERAIIWLYWLISGYGLRALRSLTVLAILGAIGTTALTGWGLAASAPATTPPQRLAGTVTAIPHKAVRIDATLSGITPVLPPISQRWTRERAQTALEVTVDSFVFRSEDQPLTTTGTWTTVAARILGPILLAFALLAFRNRVKR